MKRISALLGVGLFASQASATLVIYEPFPDTFSGGLGGESNTTNAVTRTWTAGDTPTEATDIQLSAANGSTLTHPTLAAQSGKHALLSGAGTGDVDRIGTGVFSAASDTLYYSLLLQVTDLAGAASGATGSFIAGFNNSAPNSTLGVTQAGARLAIRLDSVNNTKFNLGVQNDLGGAGSPRNFETTQRNLNQTYLVVLAYEFNGVNDADDVAKIWIDPVPGSAEPLPLLTSTGDDISTLQIQNFFLRQNTSAPQVTQIDEVRVGTTWEDVTPAVPEPSTLALAGLGGLTLLRRRRQA